MTPEQIKQLAELLPKEGPWTSIIVGLFVLIALGGIILKILQTVKSGALVVNVRLSDEDISKIKRETCPHEPAPVNGVGTNKNGTPTVIALCLVLGLLFAGCTPAQRQAKIDVGVKCITTKVVPALIGCTAEVIAAEKKEEKPK